MKCFPLQVTKPTLTSHKKYIVSMFKTFPFFTENRLINTHTKWNSCNQYCFRMLSQKKKRHLRKKDVEYHTDKTGGGIN